MSFKTLLRRVAEKTSPGRAPSYGEAKTIRALEIVSEGAIGRASLGAKLGVGEGVVRTLTRRLSAEGLLEISTRGIEVSKKGQRLLDEAHLVIAAGFQAPLTDDTVGVNNYAIHIKGGAEKVHSGIEQRDASLLAGAKGATTITYIGGALKIPGMDRVPVKSLVSFIEERFSLSEGDAVVVGTGDSPVEAETGAYAAALTLV